MSDNDMHTTAGDDRSSKYLRVSLKLSDVATAVIDGAVSLLKGESDGAGSAALALGKSLKFDATPEHRAWILVLSAVARGLKGLLSEYAAVHGFDSDRLSGFIVHGLSSQSQEFILEPDFFTNPRSHTLVEQLKPALQLALESVNVAKNDAINLLDRLPGQMAIALHNEWRSNPSYYEAVETCLKSPFMSVARSDSEWPYYWAQLIQAADENIFEETFSLRQIYVPLRAYYRERLRKSGLATEEAEAWSGAYASHNTVVDLAEHIDTWMQAEDPPHTTAVISGGPGSGKSSYAKILAARMAARRQHAILIPLHQLDLDQGIAAAIRGFLRETQSFSESPLDNLSRMKRLTLILDGLDELQMQGKAAQDAASDLVSELLRYLDRMNAKEVKLVALVTGRELAVQSTENLFKIPGQVVHLLPYHITANRVEFLDAPSERTDFHDPQKLLARDQRDLWWVTYGSLTGSGYQGLPAALKNGELDEVTAQPLLNYLVALSYRRGGLALTADTNINLVYRDLLEAVHERSWASSSHPTVRALTFDDFTRLLEEVALSVWHGAGRTTTLREVEEHCEKSKLTNLLPAFEAGAKAGVSNLLLAFYFRQKNRRPDGEKTFEFTHKSFAEYLIALRAVRAVQQLTRQQELYIIDPDSGWDDSEALFRWASVFGETEVDHYLSAFILRETRARPVDAVRPWQASLVRLLNFSLRSGWPMERFHALRFVDQQRWARNAEAALLICLNACARVTEELSKVEWPSQVAFGDMLKRLQGQRVGGANKAFQDCLSYADYSGCILHLADLYGANLEHSSFNDTYLEYTNLVSSNLNGADFRRALFGLTLMDTTNVRGTLFSERRFRDGPHDSPFGMPIIIDDTFDHETGRERPKRERKNSWFEILESRGAIFTDEEESVPEERDLRE